METINGQPVSEEQIQAWARELVGTRGAVQTVLTPDEVLRWADARPGRNRS